jgi:glycosyltransferase involved in cell wall biosynthesis
MKVSVIVPFYKVALFIERCAKSLMEQTLEDVEFIFVDDASPDDSAIRLKKIIANYNRNTKIVVHETNKGLPAARNTGLAIAEGEYIFHCDSDDWMEPTMLEDLYLTAIKKRADFVYCDFFIDFQASRREMKTPDYSSSERMVKEGFLGGMMKYNVWNKLVRRDLYNKNTPIRFPEGYSMGEDMTMIALGIRSSCVARVAKPLYHYMKTNGDAFTNTVSERHLVDIKNNADRVFGWINEWDTSDKELITNLFKLNIKLPFLFSGSYDQYRIWHELYPESNSDISKNKTLPRRTIIIQQFARLHLYPLVWLYAFAVNNIYYKIIKRVR